MSKRREGILRRDIEIRCGLCSSLLAIGQWREEYQALFLSTAAGNAEASGIERYESVLTPRPDSRPGVARWCPQHKFVVSRTKRSETTTAMVQVEWHIVAEHVAHFRRTRERQVVMVSMPLEGDEYLTGFGGPSDAAQRAL